MRVIDAHSHFFSRTYFETLAAQSPLPGTVAHRLDDLARLEGLEIPSPDPEAHLARWVAELDRSHVEHLCTFASVGQELPTVVEAAALSGGRLSAFALVDPRVGGIADHVNELLEQGKLRGALLFPALHHYHVDGPEAAGLLRVLAAHRALLFVHCGLLVVRLRDLLEIPRTQDVRYADPLDLIPAANAHPGLTFVVPHFGAGFFRETLMAGTQCANVLVDTSSSNSWTSTQAPVVTLRDVFARALDVFGASRVLFGTDSNVFPAGWRRDRLAQQRDVLDELGLGTQEQEQIFHGNARRVLRLP
jgi:uncharacterized protein